jgi:hypothetical protein
VSVQGAATGMLLDEALRLSVSERLGLFGRFFRDHPGTGKTGIGLGRAVVEFLAWEIRSGRVADRGGSPWWAAVNGLLALDIAAASAGPSAAGSAWRHYATAPPPEQQAALWCAHEELMTRAVSLASPLLEGECVAEQEFVAIVLRVLDRATEKCAPTDSSQLGDSVRRSYPLGYPIVASELAVLTTSFGRRDRHATAGPRPESPGAA